MRRSTSLFALCLLPAIAWIPLEANAGSPPTALGETASAPARVATAPTPFVVPEPTGRLTLADGETKARVEDKVAAGKPTAYRFTAPAGKMITLGISSPKSDVRLAVYEDGAKVAFNGASPEDGTIRMTVEFEKAVELRLVAHTASPETPFRFEVSLGPGSL